MFVHDPADLAWGERTGSVPMPFTDHEEIDVAPTYSPAQVLRIMVVLAALGVLA